MKYKPLLGAMLLLALLLTACGPAATASPTTMPTTVITEPPVTESPVATETAAATESPVATESPAATAPGATGVPVTGEATVMVANVGTSGQALVNGEGMALYAFSLDTGGTSACAADCTTEW